MGTPVPGCNGTVFNILKQGGGAAVTMGATVIVHTTGVIKETGMTFWSTKAPNIQPFVCQAGSGQVIPGWDHGLMGMLLGMRRRPTPFSQLPAMIIAIALARSPW